MTLESYINMRIDQRRRDFYARRARRNDRFFSVIMTLGLIVAASIALLPLAWVSMR